MNALNPCIYGEENAAAAHRYTETVTSSQRSAKHRNRLVPGMFSKPGPIYRTRISPRISTNTFEVRYRQAMGIADLHLMLILRS